MKALLQIMSLCVVFCITSLNAQDTQKWYADDIYFDASEKELFYIEIIEGNDFYMEGDSLEDYYEGQMSYSMRINRFHRDYYGSSISFNYGYFHSPFINYGYGFNDPFFNCWGTPYYGWNNYNWYNPWYSPWYYDYYNWNTPYGYAYGYGYFNTPYYYVAPIYTTTSTTIYGHRNSTNTNTPNSTISRPERNNNAQSNLRGLNIRKPVTKTSASTYDTRNKRSQQKAYTTPNKNRFEYTQPKNQSTSKRSGSRSYNNTNKSRSYISPSNNSRSNNTFSPSRSSGTNRSTSSPSRKPR